MILLSKIHLQDYLKLFQLFISFNTFNIYKKSLVKFENKMSADIFIILCARTTFNIFRLVEIYGVCLHILTKYSHFRKTYNKQFIFIIQYDEGDNS